MYYSGESNVPGAPGNFGNGGDLAVHPQPIDQRARDLMNLQQQNPELYQRLLNEKKVEGFAQPGGIPGMPGNAMGIQIANTNETNAADWRTGISIPNRDTSKFGLGTHRGISPPPPVSPALRRDMQGTQLVPQPDGSYIHPDLAGQENKDYRQRFINATGGKY